MHIKTTPWLALILVLGLVAALPASAAASQPGQPAPADQRGGEGFVPVKDLPPQDQLPAAPLLISAYAVVWVVLLVYVWSVWRRLTRVERDVRDLSTRLAARQGER